MQKRDGGHTFLDGFILRKFRHVLIQQISQSLCVCQELLIGGGELFILLVSVFTELSFRVKNPSEERKQKLSVITSFITEPLKLSCNSPVLSLCVLQLSVVFLQVFGEGSEIFPQKVLERLLFLRTDDLTGREGQAELL